MPGELPNSASKFRGNIIDLRYSDSSPSSALTDEISLLLSPAPPSLALLTTDNRDVDTATLFMPALALDLAVVTDEPLLESPFLVLDCDFGRGFDYQRDVVPKIRRRYRKMQSRHQRHGG